MSETNDYLVTLSTEIVAAYVGNHHVPVAELPTLVRTVREALAALDAPAAAPAATAPESATPAQIRKSIGQDGLVSFIDGRSYKTLKRHLTANGLDPQAYRTRYGLPADYPMTAPGYAAQRSALAKAIGLGVPGARTVRQAAE